jgi:hypothetical protein
LVALRDVEGSARSVHITPIREFAGVVHSARDPRRRYLLIFKFFCDESYDSPKEKRPKGAAPLEPKSYVVGGFFGDQRTWEKVERRWKSRNDRKGIARFHAAHLNAGTWEYDGWTKRQRKNYSRGMLQVLKDQRKHLHGVSCGLFVDEYRRIISPEGQIKMGHPYLVCFKTVVAVIAKEMDEAGYPPEDRFAVILDRGDFEMDAVRTFYSMKDSPRFKYRHRLESCTPGATETFIGLQPADFVAYETFRLMNGRRKGNTEMRKALAAMLGTTGFLGYQFGEKSLKGIKDDVEVMDCVPGGFVVFPPDMSLRRAL